MEEKVDRLIEELAWQAFLRRTGIRFIRELTAEEKKQVTDVPEYEHYRKEAKKIYEKKQKALLNKKYPVVEVPADGKSGMMGGAYVLCFVYSKYKGNVVVKGYMREVQKYVKEHFKTHYFCNYSLWNLGKNRDIWDFWKENIHISPPHRQSKVFKGKDRWKFQIYEYAPFYDRNEETEEERAAREAKRMYFKRMPKRWIPEFDKL